MNSRGSITRRFFLKITIGLSVLSCFWTTTVLAKWGGAQDSLESKLAGFFAHQESAIFVGQKYLQKVPNEANIHLLVHLICLNQPDWQSKLFRGDRKELQRFIHQQQQKDFEYGRIEKMEGWVLSKTEARLCALAALCKLKASRLSISGN